MANSNEPQSGPIGEYDRGGRGDSKSNDSRAGGRRLPGKAKLGVTVDDVKNRKR